MSTTYSQAWTVNDRKCVIPHPRKYPAAAGKANSITCPIGQPAGRAWVLMLKKDLDELLDENKDNPLATYTVRVRSQAQGARASSYAGELNWRGHFVGAAPATWENYNQDESVFVVEFADRRWRARQVTIHCEYNLALPFAYPGDTSASGHPLLGASAHRPKQAFRRSLRQEENDIEQEGVLWRLQEIVNDIWDNYLAPFLGTSVPTVKYDDPQSLTRNALEFRFHDVSAWDALCEVLFAHEMQVPVYDPSVDEFRIVSLMDNHAGDLMTGLVTSPPKPIGEFPTGLEQAEEIHGRPISDMSRYSADNDPLSNQFWVHNPVRYPFGTEDFYSRIDSWYELNWAKFKVEIDGLPAEIENENHVVEYIGKRGAEIGKSFPAVSTVKREGDWPFVTDGNAPPLNHVTAGDAFTAGVQRWLILNHLVVVGNPASSGTTEDGYQKSNFTYHGRIPSSYKTYAGIASEFKPGPLIKLMAWHDYGGGSGLSTDVHIRPGLPTDGSSGSGGGVGRSSTRPIAGWETKASLLGSQKRRHEMQSFVRPDVAQLIMIDSSDDDAEVIVPGAAFATTGSGVPRIQIGRTVRLMPQGTTSQEQSYWQPLARVGVVDIRSCNIHHGSFGTPQRTIGYPLIKGKVYLGKCVGSMPVSYKDRDGNTITNQLPIFAVDTGFPNVIRGNGSTTSPTGSALAINMSSAGYGPHNDAEWFGADPTDGEIDILVGGLWMCYIWGRGTPSAGSSGCGVQLRRDPLGGESDGQPLSLPALGNVNGSNVLATGSTAAAPHTGNPVQMPFFGCGLAKLTRGDRLVFEAIGNGSVVSPNFLMFELGNGSSIYTRPRDVTPFGIGTPVEGVQVPPWGPPY